MAKVRNDYFKLLENQVSFCVKASELLEGILSDFSVEKIAQQKDKMHEIEHNADRICHEIHTKLLAEFITPIDQEDILRLVQIIDDITDAVDEVVLYFYMYNITALPKDAVELASLMGRCIKALHKAVGELSAFKKPERLRESLVEVNSIEGEADLKYSEAIHNLFTSSDSAKEIIGVTAIYDRIESCCDLCEHASDIIDQIIIKNT